jgi:Ca2+/Na+ antiporter
MSENKEKRMELYFLFAGIIILNVVLLFVPKDLGLYRFFGILISIASFVISLILMIKKQRQAKKSAENNELTNNVKK